MTRRTSLRSCKGYTKAGQGRRCTKPASQSSHYCLLHGDQARPALISSDSTKEQIEKVMLLHLANTNHHFENNIIDVTLYTRNINILDPFESRNPEISIGTLELPTEILWLIFSHISWADVRSLKGTNFRAHSLVLFNPQYQKIVTHAPELIAVLHHAKLISAFPIHRIHDVVTGSQCSICHRFAGYIFLPGLQRCCQRCLEFDPEFMPLDLDTTRRSFSPDNEQAMNSLAMMSNLPGTYGPGPCGPTWPAQKVYTSRLTLVSKAEARTLGGKVGPTNNIYSERRFMSVMPLPSLDLKTGLKIRGLHCKGCSEWQKTQTSRHDHNDDHSALGMGCQWSLPNGIDSAKRHSEGWKSAAFASLSCRLAIASGRMYIEEGFLEHVKTCHGAQVLLEKDGTRLMALFRLIA